ncbi:hypothetical protein WSM22_19460 [Cytophagales bacterium WSM2-2]|nr:hypothetical protein WSM22_19460 [Cytophagales bacterium WSM2-2]
MWVSISSVAIAQSCSSGPNNSNFVFFNGCQSGTSYSLTGNYTITVGNNSTVKINGDVTINGTLTVDMLGSGSILEVISPYTLTATNITFSGSATGKNLIVDGPSAKIVVSNTLNFGGLNLDIDTNGTTGGSITAGSVTGGANTTCSSDGNCPTFHAGSCTGGGVCSGQGLPITLTSFSALSKSESIYLKWTTSSEINFNYFSVQKSGNGEVFDELTQVRGNGTTNEKHDYSFEDINPVLGRSYYRISSIDFDGFTETFPAVSVEYHGPKNFYISPNPADGGQVNAQLNFEETDSKASITIYDNTGSLVSKFATDGAGKISLDSQLRGGIYLARYTSSNFTGTVRFLVK